VAEPASSAQVATLTAWVMQQATARESITAQVVRQVLAIIAALGRGALYNDRVVADAARRLERTVRVGQEAVANTTVAYLRQTYDVLEVPYIAAPLDLPEHLRPVDPLVEWTRPAVQYRYARSLDLTEEESLNRAARRAQALATDDLALAHRAGIIAALAEPEEEPRGYRRIIHPELARGGTCGLCLAASDRFYSSGEHFDFHADCHCEILPIIGSRDPGVLLNNSDLGELYDRAGGTGRDALKRVRYQVQEHGELGPVLRAEGQSFRGPDDLESLAA